MKAVVTAVLLLALALTGCNSDSPNAGTATPAASAPPTATVSSDVPAVKVPPVGARLSGLCRRVNKGADAFSARFNDLIEAEHYTAAADYMRSDIVKAGWFYDQIHSLKAGPDEKIALRRYVSATDRMRRGALDAAEAIRAHDLTKASELDAEDARIRQARLEAALDLDADDCGA